MENNIYDNSVNGFNNINEQSTSNTFEDRPQNGQDKCPLCGATEISLNVKNGKLRCHFCRHEFDPQVVEDDYDIGNLTSNRVSVGASDIQDSASDIVTLQCSSCGAEVVVDTNSAMQSRCHWCRNTLSINQQVPNGSVPDVVLPFKVSREEANRLIEDFVGKRKFFAHPKFKEEFTLENVMGVYFPYMIIDINAHATFSGEGEHLIRKYTVGSGDNKDTRYDADLYHVEREFDLMIDDLTVEASADKLEKNNSLKTNNIINSILPFDTKNAVQWNANYLRGYTSEKRDVNIQNLVPQVDKQSRDIARFAANDSLKFYDRGVCWQQENYEVYGQDWKAAHLPVWLYSYCQKKGNDNVLHYVAVNARTKETMGSVPIHQPKLILYSLLIEILGGFGMEQFDFDGDIIFLSIGIIFYIIMYCKYRNTSARHSHEIETMREVRNLRKVDEFIKRRKGLSNKEIKGQNNHNVSGNKFGGVQIKIN